MAFGRPDLVNVQGGIDAPYTHLCIEVDKVSDQGAKAFTIAEIRSNLRGAVGTLIDTNDLKEAIISKYTDPSYTSRPHNIVTF